MKEVDTLEETLGGEWAGLYGEVVTHDTYRIRQVKFQPDVIFDIGANVGTFSRFAREIFPKARIIAVEPDPENCLHFRKFTKDENTILVEKALGNGQIYHGTTARNGSGETYLSAGLGYPEKEMDQAVVNYSGIEKSVVPSIRFEEFLYEYWQQPGQRRLLKMDCEGAENTIWDDPGGMQLLRMVDYIAMEVHFYALNGAELPIVKEKTLAALKSLEETHDCELDGVHFWATKKGL